MFALWCQWCNEKPETRWVLRRFEQKNKISSPIQEESLHDEKIANTPANIVCESFPPVLTKNNLSSPFTFAGSFRVVVNCEWPWLVMLIVVGSRQRALMILGSGAGFVVLFLELIRRRISMEKTVGYATLVNGAGG